MVLMSPMTVPMRVLVGAMVVVGVVVVRVSHRGLCLTACGRDQCGVRPTRASARRVAAESLADQSTIRLETAASSASGGT